MGQIREGEVDPDTALNGQNQQDRQTGRLEGKEQNDHNKQCGQHTDLEVIARE